MPVLRAASRRDWALGLLDRALKPWNPYAPERYENPYPRYEQAREAGVFFYQRSLRTWIATGHAECQEVLRSTTVSVNRTELMSSLRPYTQVQPETLDLFVHMILLQDPPEHTRLRRLVNRAFTPRAVEAQEPGVAQICQDLLNDIDLSQPTDVMAAYADRLPIFVISDMLGLPPDQWDELKELSDGLVRFIDAITAFDPAEMDVTVARFRAMLGALIDERLAEPQHDMISLLLEAEEDGDRLSRSELESMVALLMVAGHETTSGLIGNSLIALAEFPDQRDLLRANPELAPSAVEELLRYDSPVQGTDRVVVAPFAVGEHELKAGDVVGVLLGAANRDPRLHDRPNELVLDRQDPQPLSFGHGIHHCLGAALARLEARIAIPLFLDAWPNYEVSYADLEWKRSVTVRGPKRLVLGTPTSLR